MKYIKCYKLFENLTVLTPGQVEWLDLCARGLWTLNPSTGLVDVTGNFFCHGQSLVNFKGVRFGEVEGSFSCEDNNLTSLEGAPLTLEGRFYCSDNSLTTLEGAPPTVEGYFSCDGNALTSLEGAPHTVEGGFYCSDNSLTSLEGAPHTVKGSFYCENNNLTSLEGAPHTVGGGFSCNDNPVSMETLHILFSLMKQGESYTEAVESKWNTIPLPDKVLIYNSEFKWVDPQEARNLQTLARVNKIRDMI